MDLSNSNSKSIENFISKTKIDSKSSSTSGLFYELNKIKPLKHLLNASTMSDPIGDGQMSKSWLIPINVKNPSMKTQIVSVLENGTGDMLLKYHLFSWEL